MMATKTEFRIIELFGRWHIAYFVDEVMQYSIWGGYKRRQDAVRIAHIKNIPIDCIERPSKRKDV